MASILVYKKHLPDRRITLTVNSQNICEKAPFYCVTETLEPNAIAVWTQRFDDLKDAIEAYDKRVKPHMSQPGPAKPAIDLDNPPEGLQTNKGNTARVLGKLENYGDFPYVIAIHDGKQEHTYLANQSGKVNTLETTQKQLVVGPVKKEGWINVYPGGINGLGELLGSVYATEHAAINNARADRLATIKITWEE